MKKRAERGAKRTEAEGKRVAAAATAACGSHLTRGAGPNTEGSGCAGQAGGMREEHEHEHEDGEGAESSTSYAIHWLRTLLGAHSPDLQKAVLLRNARVSECMNV